MRIRSPRLSVRCGWAFVLAGALLILAAAAPLAQRTAASDTTREIVVWGFNENGELNVPAGLTNVIAFSAGDANSLALKSDGTVVAWGAGFNGELDVPAVSGATSTLPNPGGGGSSVGPGTTGSGATGSGTSEAALAGEPVPGAEIDVELEADSEL